MRYIIHKSPVNEKFYIWDTKEKILTTETGYDIILDIISDKYAVIGKSVFYYIDDRKYKSYSYQLIDISGRVVFNTLFEYVYPTDTIIYCKLDGLPINELSYLGNYQWKTNKGVYNSKNPFLYYNSKIAIIKGECAHKRIDGRMQLACTYRMIDNEGRILKEEIFKYSERSKVIKQFLEIEKQNTKVNWSQLFQQFVDMRWEKMDYIKENVSYNKTNHSYDILINDSIILHNVHLKVANNRFLLVFRNDEKYNLRYEDERKIIDNSSVCLAILNEKYELLYFSVDGFLINSSTLDTGIIINHDYIIDEKGHLYNLPSNISFYNNTCDRLGHIKIEEGGKIGYMNNRGKIIIPPIFPKDIQVGVDRVAADGYWKDYQREMRNSISDAYEEDSDAYWNTD